MAKRPNLKLSVERALRNMLLDGAEEPPAWKLTALNISVKFLLADMKLSEGDWGKDLKDYVDGGIQDDKDFPTRAGEIEDESESDN